MTSVGSETSAMEVCGVGMPGRVWRVALEAARVSAGSAARLTARPALIRSPTQADTAKLGPISQGTAKSPLSCAALRHRPGKAFRSIRCNRVEPPFPKASPGLNVDPGWVGPGPLARPAAVRSSIVYVLARNDSRVCSQGETVGAAQPGAFGQMRCSPLLKPGDRAEPLLFSSTPSPDHVREADV